MVQRVLFSLDYRIYYVIFLSFLRNLALQWQWSSPYFLSCPLVQSFLFTSISNGQFLNFCLFFFPQPLYRIVYAQWGPKTQSPKPSVSLMNTVLICVSYIPKTCIECCIRYLQICFPLLWFMGPSYNSISGFCIPFWKTSCSLSGFNRTGRSLYSVCLVVRCVPERTYTQNCNMAKEAFAPLTILDPFCGLSFHRQKPTSVTDPCKVQNVQ